MEPDDLKLADALKLALSMEQADSSTQMVRGSPSSGEIHKVKKGHAKGHGSGKQLKCFSCGGAHHRNQCKFKDATCHRCGSRGHIVKVCPEGHSPGHGQQKRKGKFRPTHQVNRIAEDARIQIPVEINGQPMEMELDTASGSSFIPKSTWRRLGSPRLQESQVEFRTYTGEPFTPLGAFEAQVSYGNQTRVCTLHVAHSPLFGRDLIRMFNLDWDALIPPPVQDVQQVKNSVAEDLQKLLEEYADLFEVPDGKIKDFQARVALKEDAVPRFMKARPVPFAIKKQLEAELQEMEKQGVVSRIEHSEWASPLVVVPKPNGRLRITGDFRYVNSQLHVTQYPIPRVEDILHAVAKGALYSKIDAQNAYHRRQRKQSRADKGEQVLPGDKYPHGVMQI